MALTAGGVAVLGRDGSESYWAVHPPSIVTHVPVIKLFAGEARNRIAALSSEISPQRPRGILDRNCSYFTGSSSSDRFISVANGPGQSAFTVTPVPAVSRDWVRMSWMSPPLLAV